MTPLAVAPPHRLHHSVRQAVAGLGDEEDNGHQHANDGDCTRERGRWGEREIQSSRAAVIRRGEGGPGLLHSTPRPCLPTPQASPGSPIPPCTVLSLKCSSARLYALRRARLMVAAMASPAATLPGPSSRPVSPGAGTNAALHHRASSPRRTRSLVIKHTPQCEDHLQANIWVWRQPCWSLGGLPRIAHGPAWAMRVRNSPDPSARERPPETTPLPCSPTALPHSNPAQHFLCFCLPQKPYMHRSRQR